MSSSRCPACGAPRLPMAFCPECRAPYPLNVTPIAETRWTHGEDEGRHELWLRRFAPPVALLLGLLAMRSGTLRAIVRIVDSMWLHEVGHAVTAWLSGFAAFPGPWRTSISETRSPLLSLALGLGLAAGAAIAWRRDRRKLAVAAALVLVVQIVLTVLTRPHRAQGLILFFGDGGAMVLGAAGVASFWAARDGYLHRTWLRWGFLFLGAFGFMDPFTTWWRARRDPDAIPYGEIDGVGDSDPSRLVDSHGWAQGQLVSRYVLLGVVCLLAVALAGLADHLRQRRIAR